MKRRELVGRCVVAAALLVVAWLLPTGRGWQIGLFTLLVFAAGSVVEGPWRQWRQKRSEPSPAADEG